MDAFEVMNNGGVQEEGGGEASSLNFWIRPGPQLDTLI